jgi:hypothetical protein
VASSNVVVLEPGRKSGCSLGVAGEDLSVGPVGLPGAVEALDAYRLPGQCGLMKICLMKICWMP